MVEGLETWQRWRELATLVTLVVVSRPHSPELVSPAGWQTQFVTGLSMDVSSSQVRQLLERGADVGGLLPPGVIRCIERRNLYAGT